MDNFKKLVVLLLLACAGIGSYAHGAAELTPYEKAVQDYISAASTELNALQKEIDAQLSASPADKEKLSEFLKKHKEASTKLEALKQAKSNQFDPLKQAYETARADMVAALDKARSG
ncbi:hypothetical protein [Oleiharenicola lentus]|uniref:hypothetical protein n=1 Tax=Oleiharenicola lentus TaxID=2508720 RepID=UPI003F67BFAB